MKFSLNLLKSYIMVDDSVDQLANHLTLKTCEIEGIEQRKIPKEVVIGKARSVEKHPDADKLFVCQIDCGKAGTFQILTGGENIVADAYVPVAIPGCYLPKIDLKITPRKMRGMDSNGMICSKGELGINEDEDQHRIWLLGGDFDDLNDDDLGKPLAEKYPRLENTVLEVDNKTVTHRPDLTGNFGLSVELQAIYQTLQVVSSEKGEVGSIKFNKVKEYLKQFESTNLQELLQGATPSKRKVVCKSDGLRSYVLLDLQGIKVNRSSFYMRTLLTDLGAQPRNNWVDFSNLFMHMTGQPVHFFDADKVEGDIIVRNAQKGELFVDLFGKQHELIPDDLVIADSKKILALAGVVGGQTSGITDDTTNILVEIANFDPVSVRKTGTRLSLRTDAELRYEKNINPVFTCFTLLLFLDQLGVFAKDIGPFTNKGLSSYLSHYTDDLAKNTKQISFKLSAVSQFIFGIQHEQIQSFLEQILGGLGFGIVIKNGEVTCMVPVMRSPSDMNIQEDIFEEVARIYGYDQILPQHQLQPIRFAPFTGQVQLTRALEEFFVRDCGFNQIETYPWAQEKRYKLFGTDTSNLYQLQNPPSPEQSYLRDKLIYNLLETVETNKAFFDEIKIVDQGKTRPIISSLEGRMKNEEGRMETMDLGAMRYRKTRKGRNDDTFLELKGLCEQLLKRCGLNGQIVFQPSSNASFHPKKQAAILVETPKSKLQTGPSTLDPRDSVFIGFVGELHPGITQQCKLPEGSQCTYLQLHCDQLNRLEGQQTAGGYETLKDQIIRRDLCFVIEQEKSFQALFDALSLIQNIRQIRVFDMYEGDKLPKGMKSVAFSIKIFGDGTMTTEQINAVMDEAIKTAEKVGAKLR